ncbi:hypothetical protein BLNAU_22486 [Blattamonas nauphoetae]|uniref:Uncharacterized protein n=1 Tax=Blattamonas nauphoetae TaxID=2049346 RepID=A0ABQ9WSW7_9EUKA|nr:hypothetical protein BLNAU_22486 [Blattamonas nauphoetae]
MLGQRREPTRSQLSSSLNNPLLAGSNLATQESARLLLPTSSLSLLRVSSGHSDELTGMMCSMLCCSRNSMHQSSHSLQTHSLLQFGVTQTRSAQFSLSYLQSQSEKPPNHKHHSPPTHPSWMDLTSLQQRSTISQASPFLPSLR